MKCVKLRIPISRHRLLAACEAAVMTALLAMQPSPANAFVFFGNSGLSGGVRWDAAPLTLEGQERSLSGGLRYSLQGGSYQAFRDQFTWAGGAPSVADFQSAVQNAFSAWTQIDPATGIGAAFNFVADLGTPVNVGTLNSVPLGAEIDLVASVDGPSWDPGSGSTRAYTVFSAVGFGTVTLTSGATGYSGISMAGSDITFNNNPQAMYSLEGFQVLLAHEIGHALGLGDVDFPPGANSHIDDNYDPSSSGTATATLTNSFARLIDPLNPAASPLSLYTVANGNPGVDSPGVDILMESSISNALLGPSPLRDDDYAGRQFLYPAPVPDIGDTDTDGDVDLADLGNLASNYGATSGATWMMGSFDDDGDVDLSDLGGLATYYIAGEAQAYADFESLTGLSVPEPSAAAAAVAIMLVSCRLLPRTRNRNRNRSVHKDQR